MNKFNETKIPPLSITAFNRVLRSQGITSENIILSTNCDEVFLDGEQSLTPNKLRVIASALEAAQAMHRPGR